MTPSSPRSAQDAPTPAPAVEPAEAARLVDYLAGHVEDDDGHNPHGQEYAADLLEEMDRKTLEAVAFEAIWRLANATPEAADIEDDLIRATAAAAERQREDARRAAADAALDTGGQ